MMIILISTVTNVTTESMYDYISESELSGQGQKGETWEPWG